MIAECGLHGAFSGTGKARPASRTVGLVEGVYAPITCDKDSGKPEDRSGAFLPETIAGPKKRESGNVRWIENGFGIVVASVRAIEAILAPERVGTAVKTEKATDAQEDSGFHKTERPKM